MRRTKVSDSDFDKLFGDVHVQAVKDDAGAYRPLLSRWILELALMFEWHKPTPNRKRGSYPSILDDDDFCELSGIEQHQDDDEEGGKQKTPAQWKTLFKRRLERVRKERVGSDLPLFRNIALLSEMLKLGQAEQMLLAFSAAISLFPLFRSCISSRNLGTSHQLLQRVLAQLSGLKEEAFQAATSEDGVLITSGLVHISSGVKDLESKVELLRSVSNAMFIPHGSTEELSRKFLKRAAAPSLTLDNFPHLAADTEVLLPFLRNAVHNKATGVNILLHGKPGVGKSEYVQALAASLGIDLYEIAFADSDGDPIKGTSRLQSFSFCQNLLARNENALLIFDEIEDVFPDNKWNDDNSSCIGKAWINRTMEHNQVPTLWVSNRVRQIDPAFLRRFDYSVKFPTPPTSVRLSIARHHLETFDPPQAWLERIASMEGLTPAQLERAAKVARLAAEGDSLKLVERVLEKSCALLNTGGMPVHASTRTGYSLQFLNTDIQIDELIEGLKQRPNASLCFHGPAGTGKSELARHIAGQVGKPCMVRRASDIFDKYVGGTEQNLAAMFHEAKDQSAVLVLDEADSFLADRRDAVRNWEVTQVNELLTQMEMFDGIFVCTTNLMEKMDPASLRRFSFKVKFDYLTRQQRWELYQQELERLGGNPAESADLEQQVRGLDRLTPGDVAVAVRQFELWGTAATPQRLYEQLAKECEAKGAPIRRIGFAF